MESTADCRGGQQAVFYWVGNRLTYEHRRPKPARGEPGTLRQQLETVCTSIDCNPPPLRVFDPEGKD